MNDIKESLLLTRDTLMFVPLIMFCFIPVMQKIKDTLFLLLGKIIVAVALVELLVFLVFLFFPYRVANLINMGLCMLIFFWFYRREIDIEHSHLLFIFLTACLIGGLGNLICYVVNIFLHPNAINNTAFPQDIFLIQILFEVVFILIIAYPTKKYIGWLVCHFHEEKIWRKVNIFPIIFTVMFYVFIPYDNAKMYIGRAITLYLIAILAFFVIAMVIYIMFYQIAFHIYETQRLREHAIYLEMEAEQYRKLQEHVAHTSRIRHDFRYHLTALNAMMERKEYEKAESYIKKYSLVSTNIVKQYCKSSSINAILNHYAMRCQEEEIRAQFSFLIKDDIATMEADFCVMLGNLLENALYACKELEKEARFLELKVGQTSPHVIVLSIRNPFDGNLKKEGNTLLSTKHPGKGHGLTSVSLIAETYHGHMNLEYDEHYFIVKVLLHM